MNSWRARPGDLFFYPQSYSEYSFVLILQVKTRTSGVVLCHGRIYHDYSFVAMQDHVESRDAELIRKNTR